MCDKGENWKAFAGGVILGGLVGAAVALLFAPKSGKETREEIKEEIEKIIAVGKEKANELKNAFKKETGEVKG